MVWNMDFNPLAYEKMWSSFSGLDIVQYSQLTKKKKKAEQENSNPEPFGEVVFPAKLQAIRLHSRTLGEFKVSLLLLCGYLVSQCKPL